MTQKKQIIALIDADILTYRCGWAAQKTEYILKSNDALNGGYNVLGKFRYKRDKKDEKTNEVIEGVDDYIKRNKIDPSSVFIEKNWNLEPVDHALQACKSCMEHIKEKTKADELKVYLTGKGNFREKIASIQVYKGNRNREEDRPEYYQEIRDYLCDRWGAEIIDGREADDEIADEFWELYNHSKCLPIIVSNDKDLKQIPGKFFDWTTGKWFDQSMEDADRVFFTQVLCGDAGDNIMGIPGCGKKKAEKILGTCKNFLEMEKAVEKAYKDFFEGNDRGKELSKQFKRTWEDILIETENLVRIGYQSI